MVEKKGEAGQKVASIVGERTTVHQKRYVRKPEALQCIK